MSNFTRFKLNDCLRFFNGKAVEVSDNGSTPVYGANGIIGFTGDTLFNDGIIIGRVGAYCGASVYEEGSFWASDNTIVVKAKANFDNKYLAYLLKVIDLNWFSGGSAQPLVTQGWLKPIEVDIPSYKRQIKIAAVLSFYDDLIANNLKRIKLLEEMAKITYEEWFVRMKFPGYETAVFDEETGLPEGWEKSTLRDLTSYVNRGVAPMYVDENGVHVINQKCIREHKVNYSDSRLTSLKQKIAGDKIVLPLDILVNSTGTGTLGRVAQLFVPNGKTTVDTHVTIVRANENTCPFWLGRSLEALEPFIESLGKGATNQQELGRYDLADLVKLNSPPGELLKKFKEIAKPTYEAISNLLNQNESLKETRDILLPRLMTGMINIEQVELPEAMFKRLEEQEDNMATA